MEILMLIFGVICYSLFLGAVWFWIKAKIHLSEAKRLLNEAIDAEERMWDLRNRLLDGDKHGH